MYNESMNKNTETLTAAADAFWNIMFDAITELAQRKGCTHEEAAEILIAMGREDQNRRAATEAMFG